MGGDLAGGGARPIEVALAEGRLEEARRLCEAALAERGPRASLLRLRARIDFAAGRLAEAEAQARGLVRAAPFDAASHHLLGQVMTAQSRPTPGAFHLERALALVPAPDPLLLVHWAANLAARGRFAEGREALGRAVAAAPGLLAAWIGLARLEEAARQWDAAAAAIMQAERLAPDHPAVKRAAAGVLARIGRVEAALGLLDALGGGDREALLEKGRLLDRMGRYDEAWGAWAEAKARTRAATGHTYAAEEAAALAARLSRFFTRARLAPMPPGGARPDVAAPIFVLGFPRSGTTLLEQILGCHSRIAAGDELPLIRRLCVQLPGILESPLTYPEALSELLLGDRRRGLLALRDWYLHQAADLGVLETGADYFTDKMPLNEMHLGLIALVFPDAPMARMRRHPLDVMVSVFSNHMTHGFHCAYDLESAARHYRLIDDLVAHYRREMDMRLLDVRYETLVRDAEPTVRAVLAHVSVDFEPACLRFQESGRVARTASAAQVTEALYDRSIGRYRHYERQLAPVMPLLEKAIEAYGAGS